MFFPAGDGFKVTYLAWLSISLIFLTLSFTYSTAAQSENSTSGSATSPLEKQAEQWIGVYGPGVIAAVPGSARISATEVDKVIIAHSQPWALARREATDFDLEDPGQVCKPVGMFRGAGADSGFQLLAGPNSIVMVATGDSFRSVRRIYFNRPHLKGDPLLWYGDSIGHWEGDTLVVDTVGFNDQTWLSGDRTRHSESLHVVERWRFVANGTYLEHQVTVEDPFALTSPYGLTAYYQKVPPHIVLEEKVCQDTPEGRRAWVKIRNHAVKELQESQKAPQ